MPPSSRAMTWSEGAATLLTFGMLMFLWLGEQACRGRASRSPAQAHQVPNLPVMPQTFHTSSSSLETAIISQSFYLQSSKNQKPRHTAWALNCSTFS